VDAAAVEAVHALEVAADIEAVVGVAAIAVAAARVALRRCRGLRAAVRVRVTAAVEAALDRVTAVVSSIGRKGIGNRSVTCRRRADRAVASADRAVAVRVRGRALPGTAQVELVLVAVRDQADVRRKGSSTISWTLVVRARGHPIRVHRSVVVQLARLLATRPTISCAINQPAADHRRCPRRGQAREAADDRGPEISRAVIAREGPAMASDRATIRDRRRGRDKVAAASSTDPAMAFDRADRVMVVAPDDRMTTVRDVLAIVPTVPVKAAVASSGDRAIGRTIGPIAIRIGTSGKTGVTISGRTRTITGATIGTTTVGTSTTIGAITIRTGTGTRASTIGVGPHGRP
jgi:hypothetical protein